MTHAANLRLGTRIKNAGMDLRPYRRRPTSATRGWYAAACTCAPAVWGCERCAKA